MAWQQMRPSEFMSYIGATPFLLNGVHPDIDPLPMVLWGITESCLLVLPETPPDGWVTNGPELIELQYLADPVEWNPHFTGDKLSGKDKIILTFMDEVHKILTTNQGPIKKVMLDFPHTCNVCGGPAVITFFSCWCSRPMCSNYRSLVLCPK